MGNNFDNLIFSFKRRVTPASGGFQSSTFNDSMAELSVDEASIAGQWNNKLVPLAATIPDGTVDSAINAFVNGLDGTSLWGDSSATTASNDQRFYSSNKARPQTISELFTYTWGLIAQGIPGIPGPQGPAGPGGSDTIAHGILSCSGTNLSWTQRDSGWSDTLTYISTGDWKLTASSTPAVAAYLRVVYMGDYIGYTKGPTSPGGNTVEIKFTNLSGNPVDPTSVIVELVIPNWHTYPLR